MKTTTLCRLQTGLLNGSTRHAATSTAPRAAQSCRVAARQRHIHTSPSKQDISIAAAPTFSPELTIAPSSKQDAALPLSRLPLSQILRTYLITSISSSPSLLNASSIGLQKMLDSNTALFDPERNPVLRAALWETFYKQFCAGETRGQVFQAAQELRDQGYAGVILEYALEVLKDAQGNEAEDVATWRKGLLDTIDMASQGDFVGLKWSGMGAEAMRLMGKEAGPSKRMEDAMHNVCEAAAAKNVKLLPAAEETSTLNGFFDWCMAMQRVYNVKGQSVVYTTYQAYLKQMPGHIAEHLNIAKKDGFTLGAKLVRGAYLHSERRNLIHPTIEDTHSAYDTIASALIHRKNNHLVQASEPWPQINVMLATHNMNSVQSAQALRQAQAARGEELTPLTYAQLQGMADEVSCSLIANAEANKGNANAVQEEVFKLTTWGTVTQCLNYLLRRAAENKDAASRTSETRAAMAKEILRRVGFTV